MKRGGFLALLGLTYGLLGFPLFPPAALAEGGKGLQWIWFNEGDPTKEAPAATRYFRKAITTDRTIDEATLDITADNQFTVWFNGALIGGGDNWKRVYSFDVKKYFRMGKNVVAVKARNKEGPAGLLVRLSYVPNGISREVALSDGSWQSAKTAAAGWETRDFDDANWQAAKILGPYGKTDPWNGLVWDSGGDDRFAVPPGFVVEKVANNPDPKDPFSLINLTFDDKGRLLVSQEAGPVLLCTKPDSRGIFQSVKPYCKHIKSSQGMCWVDDALLLVGESIGMAGLYRVRATHDNDQADQVELLHRFKGGMGEHGPHAIVHGPDNWLYVIVGNHSWVHPSKLAANSPLTRWPTGLMGPDQGKPNTTEDVLLPRQNDSRGHAANILAPGGTIWRLDRQAKNMSLVTAGFRNAFDLAFSPDAEMFTFDSDMEWDLELPWYRPVRVCHCPPGADFLWRTGASNTPDYYIDSLPPILETGRGSPVGLEFYDHHVFPKKYQGAYFMADWSLGIIYAVHLERNGASYQAKAERFCVGNPMNVTDIVVGPDGALYFTMGGRHSQGGVYRIAYRGIQAAPARHDESAVERILHQPQPLAAWSRAQSTTIAHAANGSTTENLTIAFTDVARDTQRTTRERTRALDVLQNHLGGPAADVLLSLAKDRDPKIRAHALWLLGASPLIPGASPTRGKKETHNLDLLKKIGEVCLIALQDTDALIRRRACEMAIRSGYVPAVAAIWPLLNDPDRFVRTAARLVLQRIDPQTGWGKRLTTEAIDHSALEAIIALCKINKANGYAGQIFERLHRMNPQEGQALLDYLRTVQVALVHTSASSDANVTAIAERCLEQFPHADWRVNRELAILLAHFGLSGILKDSVPAKLMPALLGETNRQQQIHYFYCLRLVKDGWTPELKNALLVWYDGTKTWEGGHSFTPFLENILRDAKDIFTTADRSRIIAHGETYPLATLVLLKNAAPAQLPSAKVLMELYERLPTSFSQVRDLRDAIVDALARSSKPESQAALRALADRHPSMRDKVAQGLAQTPSVANWAYLVRGLESTNSLVLFDVIEALKKIANKPKADDPTLFRALLLASGHLDESARWKAVELLRQWSNDKQFGADPGDWKGELSAWSRWFGQTFPKEPTLPFAGANQTAPSKYSYGELLAFLEKDPAGIKGDATRGRVAFEKAQCLKCHKYGKAGEGVGPDLTTVSKRFKRVDILESIYYPSKVISDQYRSTTILTKKGQQITGLAAPQGDIISVLRSDGTKVTLKRDEVDQQFASLISVMPEKLLDELSKQEIADLFAYMESEPK